MVYIPWEGWNVVGVLGSGGFGTVYKIQRTIFDYVETAAVKVICLPHDMSEIDELRSEGYNDNAITAHYRSYLEDIVREYTIMSKLKGHSNVVDCDDVFYCPNENGIGWRVYLKMELLTPINQRLDTLRSEQEVIRLGIDMCNAMVLCQGRNIVHRDIKPQNIFVSADGDYKLGDFGVAKISEHATAGTKIGTYKYMAPEVYNNQSYGTSADIYSLGMVLYWLLNDYRLPFLPKPPAVPTAGEIELSRTRRFSGEPIPAPVYGSKRLKDIVLKACAFSPLDRYTSAARMLADLRACVTPGANPRQPARADQKIETGQVKPVMPPAAPPVAPQERTIVSPVQEPIVQERPGEVTEVLIPGDRGRMDSPRGDISNGKSYEGKKKRNLLIAIGISAAVLAALVCVVIFVMVPMGKFDSAMALFEDSKYEEAKTSFAALGDYKNSQEMILDCDYQIAMRSFDGGNYNEAKALFAALGNHKNAGEMMLECDYQVAMDLYESGDFDTAKENFKIIYSYKNSLDMTLECDYQTAMGLYNSGNYNDAKEAFAALGNYSDAVAMVERCIDYTESDQTHTKAQNLMRSGDYLSAAKLLLEIEDVENVEEDLNACYQYGLTLLDDGSLDEALELFQVLEGYKDSLTMQKECNYRKATNLLSDGKTEDAKKLFFDLGDYSDAENQYYECSTILVRDLTRSGKYEEASKEITNTFGQSTNEAKALYYELATTCKKQKAYTEALSAFRLAGTYSDAEALFEITVEELIKYNEEHSLLGADTMKGLWQGYAADGQSRYVCFYFKDDASCWCYYDLAINDGGAEYYQFWTGVYSLSFGDDDLVRQWIFQMSEGRDSVKYYNFNNGESGLLYKQSDEELQKFIEKRN